MSSSTTKDAQVSLRLPLDMKQRIEAYAEVTGRNQSHVVMEAVGEYLGWRVPQVEDLKAAVSAADAGDFATDDEVQAVFARYTRPSSAQASSGVAKGAAKKARPRRAA
jgi:RHH-type transcriptional regulator, rel operon repressor / antitoxin RelB